MLSNLTARETPSQQTPQMPPLSVGAFSPQASSPPLRLLCIDDQPIIAEALRRLLADLPELVMGYCPDPEQALSVALDFKPNVILQDLIMPQMDGLVLLQRFRAHPAFSEVPIIVLSTKEDPILKAEAFALGASDYMVKFPNKLELLARLRYHNQAYLATLQRNAAYQALRDQLNQAARYVQSLLPQPSQTPIQSEWAFLPSEKLGGDVFDYQALDADHLAVYLLDVCDHGIGPALLSISIFNLMRTRALAGVDFRDPASVLQALNKCFPESKQDGNFFTIWYGVYHHPTRRLTYASGGHPPALVFSPDPQASPLFLNPTGPTVGIFEEAVFKNRSVDIVPGARLYLFSDGAYEVTLPGVPAPVWTLADFSRLLGQLWAEQGARSRGPSLIPALVEHIQKLQGKTGFDDDFSLIELGF